MRKIWPWVLVGGVLLAVGSYGIYMALQPKDPPAGFVYGNGRMEGTEVRVSAEVTGRVVENRLVEGANVARGALLVRLDDADEELGLAAKRAEQQATHLELVAVGKELATWKHHLRTAVADFERYRSLRSTGAVTPQQLGKAEDRVQEARGQVDALQARQAEVTARLEAGNRQVELLEHEIEKTRIRSPLDATVLVKAIEAGEFATPGRVVAVLVDLSRIELEVYVSERAVGRIRLGAPARVRVDAFRDRSFDARVKRVDQRAQFTPGEVHMPDERVRTVFGVTLAVRNDDGYLKPGMPADAWIRWDPKARWPQRLWVPR